jgi:hypothetical protein
MYLVLYVSHNPHIGENSKLRDHQSSVQGFPEVMMSFALARDRGREERD